MLHLSVRSFGPIREASVQLGDLTLLIGPQASGKSIFVQLLKLLVDKYHIRKTLQQYNYIWGKDTDKILDLYFGEGMAPIWKPESEIVFDKKGFRKDFLLPKSGRGESLSHSTESLFTYPHSVF